MHVAIAYVYAYLYISYNMGKRDLPDIYALARGQQAQGRGHLYQANLDCPYYKRYIPLEYTVYHIRQIKESLNPQLELYLLARLLIHLLNCI